MLPNLRSQVSILKDMNLTNDPEIDKVCNDIMRNILTVDNKNLREDENLRDEVKEAGNDILNRVGQFGQAPVMSD